MRFTASLMPDVLSLQVKICSLLQGHRAKLFGIIGRTISASKQ